MGNFAIHIEGVGAHHNGVISDANELIKKFVAEMRTLGHRITHASFHHGGAEHAIAPSTEVVVAPPMPYSEPQVSLPAELTLHAVDAR